MKWKKVSRLTLPLKGKIVKWTKERRFELVRADGVYEIVKRDEQPSGFVLRRCPHCKVVQIFAAENGAGTCPYCEEFDGEILDY